LIARLSSRVWLAVIVAAVLLVAGVFGGALAERVYLNQTAARGETTLRLAVSALQGHMSRFEALPALLADRQDIRRLIASPRDDALRSEVNRYLKATNMLLGSSDIYVMIRGGDTVAASNFDTDLSFVGENFSYRPYYQQAMEGRPGRFFALGTTSLKRGYYFSAPVLDGSSALGVIVFKVDLDQIEASWAGGDYEMMVADPEGIIFMTSRREWLYAGLLPLSRDRLQRTQDWRRYADTPLKELAVRRSTTDDGRNLMTLAVDGAQREYLVQSEEMKDAGWTVNVLTETRSARTQAITSLAAIMLLIGLAGLVAAIVLQRRARLAERLDLQRAAQELLERRVEERTADLAEVNRQLETEVNERRATEQQLRQTQSDLIQAGKLAALGQMSAALSHEFNQPLAAVKAYAENGATLIDRDRVGDARDNLARISSLADRMSSISRHLRNFAREPNQTLGPVPLADVVKDTLEIATPRLKTAGATVDVDISPQNLTVRGGVVRLQQVLVNLISNAADAVEDRQDRRISLVARRKGQKVTITVRDRGPGVPEAIRERIFDPFYSTKGVGKGLGLGLSISYNIVKDFGGRLSVENHSDGGAIFSIELDSARQAHREAAE
jgi:two-component system C4-dicarboxylate transport sensor histidine kinase DctB